MHTSRSLYAGALRGDGQSNATTFPPPLWGRDRERGTTALLLVRSHDPISPAPQPFAVLRSGEASSSVPCGHPSPCPSPTRGREPCGAHLRASHDTPCVQRCVQALTLPR